MSIAPPPPELEHGDLTRLIWEDAWSKNPMAPRHLAQKLGVNPMSVHRIRARLRYENKLPKRRRRVFHKKTAPEEPVAPPSRPIRTATEADIAAIITNPSMDKEERIRALSDIARSSTDSVRISAIKALEDFERITGQTIGPPAPLTQDEQAERLSRLMAAVGRETTDLALKLAFSEAPVELSQETSQIDARSPDGDSGVGGLDTQD